MREAFDSEQFRAAGHRVIDALADHLRQTGSREVPVLPWRDPVAAVHDWGLPPSEGGGLDEGLATLARWIEASNHLHHPGYVGHQVPPGLPLAALADAAVSLLNNSMTIFEMSPAGVPVEIAVVRWMCGTLGFGAESGGVLCDGGSIGNLTALVAAREAVVGSRAGEVSHQPRLAVLASDQAHYCIGRAAQVMGCEFVPVASDAAYRMDIAALEGELDRVAREGVRVFAVAASVCNTPTGSFDPLEPIADMCQKKGLWLHADGAHGASVVLSERHRHLVRGIERADSVTWDAHKMLMMPSLVTGVLFKRGDAACETYAQRSSYLLDRSPKEEWFNPAHMTIECTRRNMAVPLYVSLRAYGVRTFADHIDHTVALARQFAAEVQASGDFELALDPPLNIVCFRYRPAGMPEGAKLDNLQARLRERVLRSGKFYFVKTRLRSGLFLRTTLLNPRTTIEDLRTLMETVRVAAGGDNEQP
ncbi:MAG TPA: aminotransferase class I/II-fold pyridoxal phosphate-dependent enzyme [Phycisphaerales bacterium]